MHVFLLLKFSQVLLVEEHVVLSCLLPLIGGHGLVAFLAMSAFVHRVHAHIAPWLASHA